MDMDATLRGYPLTEETIREAFMEICAIQMDDEVTLALDHRFANGSVTTPLPSGRVV